MQKRFLNKTAVITGASSGIGAVAARQFAAEGARVVLAARRKELLDDVAQSIGADTALAVPTDVEDMDDIAALLERAEQHFGRVDILVNNAGYHARGPCTDQEPDELARMVDVNLRAPAALCRMALPYLRRAGGGAIINVSSLSGRIPIAGAATYSATKAGLRFFSLALAQELSASGITVSVVCPGPVDTNFFEGQFDRIPDLAFAPPMRSAEQVARLILACAYDGKPERTIPRISGYMTTIGYVFPQVRRLLRPVLERVGRSNRNRYLKRKAQS